jgi:hypothetical protein
MLVANNPPCGSDTIYFDVTVAQSNSSVSKLGLNGLVISPNPTSDLMNVKFSGFEQELRAEILSIDGQVVSVNEFKMLNGNIGFTLNLENLTDGIYILHLRNDSFETVNRIQIQH